MSDREELTPDDLIEEGKKWEKFVLAHTSIEERLAGVPPEEVLKITLLSQGYTTLFGYFKAKKALTSFYCHSTDVLRREGHRLIGHGPRRGRRGLLPEPKWWDPPGCPGPIAPGAFWRIFLLERQLRSILPSGGVLKVSHHLLDLGPDGFQGCHAAQVDGEYRGSFTHFRHISFSMRDSDLAQKSPEKRDHDRERISLFTHHLPAVAPPSMTKSLPVTKEDSSEAR